MATLTRQALGHGGLNPPAMVAAAAGLSDQAPCGGGTVLVVRNTNAATRVVTVNDPNSRNPGNAVGFDPDVEVTVAGTTGEVWIPLGSRFADPANGGRAVWNYSASAGVTVAVIQVPTS